jgi:hypothetical protein
LPHNLFLFQTISTYKLLKITQLHLILFYEIGIKMSGWTLFFPLSKKFKNQLVLVVTIHEILVHYLLLSSIIIASPQNEQGEQAKIVHCPISTQYFIKFHVTNFHGVI